MTNITAVVALMAAQIGAPLPPETAPVVVPVVSSKLAPARATAVPSYITGSAFLQGSGYLSCSAPRGGSGSMSGSVDLRASVSVTGPNGESGIIPVSGYAFLNGMCQNGAGFVSGTAWVSGQGYLYGRDGKLAGTLRLNSPVSVNQYASSSFVFVSQYATLSGYLEPAN